MHEIRRQISQKVVAVEAGVSQATVSLVLAGRDVGSDQTRKQVLEAAKRLRYRPNLLVQGIQTGKTRMIGVMAPPYDFFWSEVLYGIHDVLTNADHVSINLWAAHRGPGPRQRNSPSGDELEQIHRLIDRRVDGVILWPAFASMFMAHIHEFSSRNLPVVTIDHELPAEFRADSVFSEDARGGRAVAAHLLALGHRNVGHLAGAAAATWAVRRRSAFEGAIAECPGATCFTVEADHGDDTTLAIKQARELLAMPDRPTAIFAASDLYAKQVYHAAAEQKIRIPQDLSLVGYSDDDFAAELFPPLTTVRQPAYDMGCKAAELVLARTKEVVRREPQNLKLPVELVVRGSTAPLNASRNTVSGNGTARNTPVLNGISRNDG